MESIVWTIAAAQTQTEIVFASLQYFREKHGGKNGYVIRVDNHVNGTGYSGTLMVSQVDGLMQTEEAVIGFNVAADQLCWRAPLLNELHDSLQAVENSAPRALADYYVIACSTGPLAVIVLEADLNVLQTVRSQDILVVSHLLGQAWLRCSAQALLAQEQIRLRYVLNELPVAVIVAASPDGELIFSNKEADKIWRQQFVKSRDFESYRQYKGYHRDGRPFEPEDWAISRALKHGIRVKNQEIDILRGDNTWGVISSSASPIRDEKNQVEGAVVAFIDITEQAHNRRSLELLHELMTQYSLANTTEEVGKLLARHTRDLTGADVIVTTVNELNMHEILVSLRSHQDEKSSHMQADLSDSTDTLLNGINMLDLHNREEKMLPSMVQQWYVWPIYGHDAIVGALCFSDKSAALANYDILSTIMAVTGQIMDRSRWFDFEREASSILQKSLAPRIPRAIQDGQLRVMSRPATTALDIGGDWHDIIMKEDQILGLAIGDIVGKGIRAAAAMGQLRMACDAISTTFSTDGRLSPAEVIQRLDEIALRIPGSRLSTLAYIEVNTFSGRIRYSRAGHPPPVMLLPGGGVAVLDDSLSPPLAATERILRENKTHWMVPGAVLLLCTDGLIERRGNTLDEGLKDLVRVLSESDAELGDAVNNVQRRLLEEQDYEDDVTLLAFQWQPKITHHMTRTYKAEATEVVQVRKDIQNWLNNLDSKFDVQGVLIAASEAVSNSIEHGYGHGQWSESEPNVRLDMWLTGVGSNDVTLHVRIADWGMWKTDTDQSFRGRGMEMISTLCKEASYMYSQYGTTIMMRFENIS